MVYLNNDPCVLNVMDKALTGGYDSGVVGAVCAICGESIYKGDEYYSNGDMDICCSCHQDFIKIWD